MPSINLFDLFAKISLDTSDYDKGVDDAGKKGKSLASTLKSGLASAGKMAATGLAAIGTAAGAAVGGLLALESSTEEYRIAMGKLNTAFESAGYSADTAKEAYNAFYGILGDTDTATEASQLLAKLAENEEDVATWTNIAAGVAGTFGDSLPIESLIEASNETAKVGTVTGTLADALNWAGISEDAFNEKLAACSTESERNRLIMDTLSGTYDEASAAFYRNNEALVQSRENQAKIDEVLGRIGESVSRVKNAFIEEFGPTLENMAGKVATFVENIDAEAVVNKARQIIDVFLELSPIIAGAAGAFVTYKAAISISNIVDALTNATKNMSLAQAALNAVMNANPLAKVAALVGALVAALITLWNTNEDFRKAVISTWNKITGTISSAVGEIKNFFTQTIPEAAQAALNWLKSIPNKMVGIGEDIVKGIWQGIQNMKKWIKDKVTGFFGGIVDGVKDFLGIHSPSKLFRDEIGQNIGLGVAEGLEDSEDEAVKAANKLAESVYNKSKEWLDRQTKYQNFSSREQLEVWQAIQDQFIKGSKQYADAEEQIFDLRQKIREEDLKEQEEFKSKVEAIYKSINDLEAEYQSTLESRSQEIFDAYGLFDEIPKREKVSGDELISNLESQLDTMGEFYDGLDELAQRGVSEGLIQDIRDMGPKAVDQLSALLALTDDKLSEYDSLYREKQQLANNVATKELEDLRKETDKKISENMDELSELYRQRTPAIGKLFSEGLASGILNQMDKVANAAVTVAQSAVSAIKNTLGINSPSKVLEEIGENMALGLGNGWANQFGIIQQGITSGFDFGTANVDFASSGLGRASAATINAAAGNGGQAIDLTANLVLPDGRLLASFLFSDLVNFARANGTPIVNPT